MKLLMQFFEPPVTSSLSNMTIIYFSSRSRENIRKKELFVTGPTLRNA
jgi:hypothetical protein